MNRNKTLALITVALTAAIMAITAQISFPLPSGIPITLQTLGAAFAGYLLGLKYGSLAVGVYISIGAMGAPIFSGFTGGFQKFLSPTGGYIWGLLLLALICGAASLKKWSRHEKTVSISCGIIGTLICHTCGLIQFSAITQSNPMIAATVATLPYIPKDIICIISAYLLAHAIKKRLPSA